jgi:signal transduction histidine kinase
LIFRKLAWVFHPVVIFIVAQLSWILLMVVWIQWYVSRNEQIDDIFRKFQVNDAFDSGRWIVLVEGCILMGVILIGLYFIFVSLRKQTKLNKLQDAILSSVTHELKTPLASIRLVTETIMLRELSFEEREQFLKRTMNEVQRLQKLIDTVLISARLSSSRKADALERADALQILGECWSKITERFSDVRNFSAVWPADEGETFFLSCVPHQLEIAFDNLFDNAVKYSLKDGSIKLHVATSETKLSIVVSDDGIGINRKNLKRIFKRFFRAEVAEKKMVHGSGLGLYVCQNIIKQHAGKIYAASNGEGKGAEFHVEFKRIDSFD